MQYKRHMHVLKGSLRFDNFPLIFGFTELYFLKTFGEGILILAAIPFVWGPGGRGSRHTCWTHVYCLAGSHVAEVTPAVTSVTVGTV